MKKCNSLIFQTGMDNVNINIYFTSVCMQMNYFSIFKLINISIKIKLDSKHDGICLFIFSLQNIIFLCTMMMIKNSRTKHLYLTNSWSWSKLFLTYKTICIYLAFAWGAPIFTLRWVISILHNWPHIFISVLLTIVETWLLFRGNRIISLMTVSRKNVNTGRTAAPWQEDGACTEDRWALYGPAVWLAVL